MLAGNLKESELSIAYVHALAIKGDFEFDMPRIDNDSVDVYISANGELLSDECILHSPKIDIQLKATTNWQINAEDKIAYDLKIKNYNDLRRKSAVPKILVLLCLPKNKEEWIIHSSDELILRKCAYWVSLLNMPPTENETTVRVFLSELFTHDILKELLIKISKQEW
jgi:hypothetical protein